MNCHYSFLFALGFFCAINVSAAEFIKGYTLGNNSQLLEANHAGAGGTHLFVDQAMSGGADLRADGGNPIWGWEIPSNGNWALGDDVTFTGIALPVWANDPDGDGENNTQNAVWRLRFYSTGPNGDWQGSNNLATSDDSFIAAVDVNFNLAGNGTGVYRAVFDTPLVWNSADSTTIWWYLQSLGGKAHRLKTGEVGAIALRENRLNGNSNNDSLRMSLAGTVAPLLEPPALLDWSPALGGGNGNSLFQEANWVDPINFVDLANGLVDPNVVLDRTLRIRLGNPGGGSGANGNVLLGTGELEVANAGLRLSAGNGIDLGPSNPSFIIRDGRVFAETVSNAEVVMQGQSSLTLYGNSPLINTTVDLQSSDCFVYYLNRLPGNMNASSLSNFTVNGVPAEEGVNVSVRAYYQGSVLRANPPGGVALKAFDLPDLQGQRWNFNGGFKGQRGLGLSAYDADAETYTVAGWGDDIWGTEDQGHYLWRTLNGNGEMIVRVDNVADTHVWAKAGIMIREDLSAGARNAYLFQRPDKQVAFQRRFDADAASSTSGALGGTNDVKYLKLERAGNQFTASYSTNGTTYTQVGSVNISMANSVHIGLAATSRIGFERGINRFSQVTLPGVPATGPLGIFSETAEFNTAWGADDQISSFLLKKGFMVVVATEPGGQGKSKFYAATEKDLKVNLADDGLDNAITFMRVLPWRWVSRKGWAGSDTTHMNNLGVHWNYAWEPTGLSTDNREWVPMIRGRNQDKEFRWEEVRVRGNQTHFLGFNEPESVNQGDLSVAEAIALWPKAQQLGLRLGSPARTDGANGNTWLTNFMTQAAMRDYRVDYICVHNYNQTDAADLQSWLEDEYAKYQLPIWLTEFSRAADDTTTAAEQLTYISEVVAMLESLPFIERYAYYNFLGNNSGLFNGDKSTNERGDVYAGIVSNPGYRNRGQPNWSSLNLTLPGSGNVLVQGRGANIRSTVAAGSGNINRVEYYSDGLLLGQASTPPYTLALDQLTPGLHHITAQAVTGFGEQVSSAPRQVIVSRLEIMPLVPDSNGTITWSAVPGETYRVEFTDDLASGNWTLLTNRNATGTSETVNDGNAPANTRRYYRVAWVD